VPRCSVDDFFPPMMHGQMSFTNAGVCWLVEWIDRRVQKVGSGEKAARLAALNSVTAVREAIKKCDDKVKDLSDVLKQLKVELKMYRKGSSESSDADNIEQHHLNELLTEEEIKEIERGINDVKEDVRNARKQGRFVKMH
jgi:uncharacterized protein (DUF342 family)